jgi:hypothetical protein
MASDATDYLANKLLDHIYGGSAYTQPTVYIGLSTNGSTEISGNGYARVEQSSSAAGSGANTSDADLVWPTPTASWGSVAYAAEFDAATSGNQLTGWKTLTGGPFTVAAWDTFSIPAGDIDRTM